MGRMYLPSRLIAGFVAAASNRTNSPRDTPEQSSAKAPTPDIRWAKEIAEGYLGAASRD